MKTYVHIKSGNRYPSHGCSSWFTTWTNGKFEHHIKPGYAQCTNGWKKVKVKEWREEEVPDLAKPFTKAQWIEYAEKYGTLVAQEFLECCDYMKPSEAYRMTHPPANEKAWLENEGWFKAVFGEEIWRFMCGLSWSLGNTYALDILKFENYLKREHRYPAHEDGSMADFMASKFGAEVTDKFRNLFLTPNEN